MQSITTLGALKASGYTPRTIKAELRQNLLDKLRSKTPVFEGIYGFDDTVLPDIERAVLSQHSILLLGLRGQAKTRLARLLVHLLDEYVPIVAGSDLNDDPLQPLSRYAKDLIAAHGDDTPVAWLHRSARYVEKLATPDVSVADLIGDVDPVKAATLKLPYSDERVIHFGLVPHANRCIFCINELPDLQARIQVALFNILQEGDIQIRGFKLRLPLDVQFIFTANPEDYTNRGSIITPLKDRIESQILTHYPLSIEIARHITAQEAKLTGEQRYRIAASELVKDFVEQIAFVARESDLIDSKSGVSARLTISAYENLIATAERRMIRNDEAQTTVRLADFAGVIPAITGKVELVYEGEQEGPYQVALALLAATFKQAFLAIFPNPDKLRKGQERDPYGVVNTYFAAGHQVTVLTDAPEIAYRKALDKVAGLAKLVMAYATPKDEAETYLYMELVLHGLAACNHLSQTLVGSRFTFSDPLADLLTDEAE